MSDAENRRHGDGRRGTDKFRADKERARLEGCPVEVPNALTRETMTATEAGRNVVTVKNVDALVADLDGPVEVKAEAGCVVCRCGGNSFCKCSCHDKTKWKTADEVMAKLDEQVKKREEEIRADERKKIAAANTEGLREAINKRVNEFYGSGASAFSIDSREMAAKQCIADLLEIANSDAALRGEGEPPEPDPNADGPAERAHRQDEARRMK